MIIEREIYAKIKSVLGSREAIIITGMRRVGKTTLLKYIFDNLSSANKIFLDLENPVNQQYFEEKNYEKILDNFKFLGLDAIEKGYVFLDEIQFVKNAASVVKYLSDNHDIKFFLSGSASFYLKNLFSESLAGRKYIFELFPLSFKEFLALKGIKIFIPAPSEQITEAMFSAINLYYDEYLSYGGFPGVVKKDSIQEKTMALDDIFSSYFQMEVQYLGDFRKTNTVRDLMLLLMQRTGSRLDVQKLSSELGVSRPTVSEYVSFLESTYFIKLVSPFSRNRDSEIRRSRKFYLCDTGLINRFAKLHEGLLFENAVFSALRLGGEVNYYQKKSGAEIDFVLDKKYAFEVKINPRKQDLNKLRNIANELKIKDYKIVSRKFSRLRGITYGFVL